MDLAPLRPLALMGLLALAACGGGGGSTPLPPPPAPTVSAVAPTHGTPGSAVVLTGTNLNGISAVSFNGQPAFSFTSVNSTTLDAVVPGNAPSGAIHVTALNGTAASPTFTVDAAQAPTITSFAPAAFGPGSTVTVNGTHFVGATQVTFNAVKAPVFNVASDAQLLADAPAGLTPGTIAVTTPAGTATSSSTYTVTASVPVITALNPTMGPVGTPVVITGNYLGYPGTTLTLNGQSVPLGTQSASQITFTVPVGASTGSLVLATPGGTLTRTFTVLASGPTLDLHIEKAQLTQSTQTLDNAVPIVAGKAGLIRVFVLANQANAVTPAVRVTLKNNGVAVIGYPKNIPAPGGSVPTVLDESSLGNSWNLAVPAGDLTTPIGGGYTVEAVVDPLNLIPECDETNNSPTPFVLSGTAVPPFKTTIFPIVLASTPTNVSEANKDAWVARLAKMYPVGSVDVQVGAPFTPSVGTVSSDGTNWGTVLSDLATKHQADGATDRYYYGALDVSYSSGVAGLGYVPSSPADSFYYRTAIGWDQTGHYDGGNYPEVLAHETGHNMGRNHSPCGNPSGVDPNYPYAGGSIGVWGYDSTLNSLYSPATYKDIMAYCPNVWASDYTYKGILNFRAGAGGFLVVGAEDAPLPRAQAVARECLIVRGFVHDDGRVELLPAFRTRALPSALTNGGEFTLAGLDQKGAALFTAPIELMEVGCSPTGHERHFILALPLDGALLDALGGLDVLRAGRVLASRRSTTVPMASQPSLQRLGAGQVQATWDAGAHPTVLVRDADSGEVLAILSGGRRSFTTRARRFDLVLSDGVTGRTHRLETPN